MAISYRAYKTKKTTYTLPQPIAMVDSSFECAPCSHSQKSMLRETERYRGTLSYTENFNHLPFKYPQAFQVN